MISKLRDPVSSLTHMIGAVLAIPILISLVYLSSEFATPWHTLGFFVFGVSLFLLYGASATYHAVHATESTIQLLRRIDHMMIFVLIAGTYTPICLVILHGPVGLVLLALMWTMAIAGIFIKLFWLNAPRWLSTALYVVMGWSAVLVFYPLLDTMSLSDFGLILLGGILYTIGAVIYATKWPKITGKWVGFHEIFHIFVLAATACHVLFMYQIVLPFTW